MRYALLLSLPKMVAKYMGNRRQFNSSITYLFKTTPMPRNFITRFKKIDQLIHQRKTGNASELAQLLSISERTTKEFIKVMKEQGAPIYFSRVKNSYCYKEAGRFNISFVIVQ
jgi:hypothetical protein